nr:MAG TPA: hypothetical protein [Caudoviricetes sp.]DAP44432.1 MAG TPA: hypothetical protein [Bacteriophage sp.]
MNIRHIPNCFPRYLSKLIYLPSFYHQIKNIKINNLQSRLYNVQSISTFEIVIPFTPKRNDYLQ